MRPTTAASTRTAMSTVTTASKMSARELRTVMNVSKTRDLLEIVAQVLIITTPVIVIIILATVRINHTYGLMAVANQLQEHYDRSRDITQVINRIQKERTAVCGYTTDSKNITDSQTSVNEELTRLDVNRAKIVRNTLSIVRSKPPDEFDGICGLTSLSYHTIIQDLVANMAHGVQDDEQWRVVTAQIVVYAWTLGAENYGLLRGYGGGYHASGALTMAALEHMTELEVRGNTLFQFAAYHTDALDDYQTRLMEENATIVEQFLQLRENHAQMTKAVNVLEGSPTELAFIWFSSVTDYMTLLRQLVNALDKHMYSLLDETIDTAVKNLIYMSISSLLTTLLSITMAACYFEYARRARQRMATFAHNLSEKTDKLTEIEDRTHQLLCQMMPKQMVIKLRMGEQILPEPYDIATVLFCGLVDFDDISKQSTPDEIVCFLNDLLFAYDKVIDMHDCYKVETIGDELVVVSGAPVRNGTNHSAQMASLALKLIGELNTMVLEHLDNRTIEVRCGLSTGALTVGIVGHRAPRCCVFGDAVNTSARMKSNAKGSSVLMAYTTHDHLAKYHIGFETFKRGEVVIKGKGSMTTYWLVSMCDYKVRLIVDDYVEEEATCIIGMPWQ